jgi:hypothetical protein
MRTRARNADVGGGRTRFASGGEWPARVDEYVVEEPERGTIDPVRKQQFPIVGDGRGIWSWIHLDDAAAASVLALEQDGPGIYNQRLRRSVRQPAGSESSAVVPSASTLMTKGQGYGRLVSDALVRDVPTSELETPLEAAAEPLDGRWPLRRGRRGGKGTFGRLRPNAEAAARDDRGPRPLACSASSPARRARARDGAGHCRMR